jgi:hypothetical protein
MNIVEALQLIEKSQFAQVLQAVRELGTHIKDPDFDFESASNLMALLAQLATKAIRLEEVDPVVDQLGLRFCGTRALAELLAGSTANYPPYAERIRAAHGQILRHAESAMSMSMAGDPRAAVVDLIAHGETTLSGKLIETAYLVLHRYAEKISDAKVLSDKVHELRSLYGTQIIRAALGEQKRQAGGLTLRAGGKTGKP